MQRLEPAQCAVVVIDLQDKLLSAMPASRVADVLRAGNVLIEAAALLGARVIATEQYPAGLGHTVAPIADGLERLGLRSSRSSTSPRATIRSSIARGPASACAPRS